MQLRLVSSSYYRLPQRVEAVEDVSARAQQAGEESSRQQQRTPVLTESDNARREYYYSRIEAVAGRTAEALRSYTEVENGADREQIQAQLGLDIYA